MIRYDDIRGNRSPLMISGPWAEILAQELTNKGYNIDFTSHRVLRIVDEQGDLVAAVFPQLDGYLVVDHTRIGHDIKPSVLVRYDLPDMLERILCILGE